MSRKQFSDGQEIVEQDLNDLQAMKELEIYDRVVNSMLQNAATGFFADAFKVLYVGATAVNVSAGVGFQFDNSQVSPEPKRRLYFLPNIVSLSLSTPHATLARIDLICSKAVRVNSKTESRNIKDGVTGDIALASVVTETDWLSDVIVVAGTPSGSPVAPSVPSGYEKIATLAVAAVSGLAGQGSITDNRTIIPAADQTIIDTSSFPAAVVTQSVSARLKTVLLQLANYADAHDSAVEIPASASGHTIATGSNVQSQLDQIDSLLTALENAITHGAGADLLGYDPTTPADWNVPVPSHVGPALDQLAGRMEVVETGTNIGEFVTDQFGDFVVPADSPQGAGNTGLVSNGNTNPRGIKLADGKLYYGEERILFRGLEPTGEFDAAGLPEWYVNSPNQDIRVRLYGQWGFSNNSENVHISSRTAGDYILITGVFDALAIMCAPGSDASDMVAVSVDGVSTGGLINTVGSATRIITGAPVNEMHSDPSLEGLSQGLHTVMLVNGATGTPHLKLSGVTLINTLPVEMASNAYVKKVLTGYAKQAVSVPSVGNKGAKIMRYIDPADGVRKDAFQNVTVVDTAVTGSLTAGNTSFTVNSAVGLAAGDLLLIKDGPSNSEIIKATAVNTGTGSVTVSSPGLVNNYTDPSVSLYCKALTSTDHSNEIVKTRRHHSTFGVNWPSVGVVPTQLNGVSFIEVQMPMEDGAARIGLNSARSAQISPSGEKEVNPAVDDVYWGILPNASGPTGVVTYEFFGTGLDIFFSSNGAGGTYDVKIDGELAGSLVVPAGYAWKKICSDLPLGHHVITFTLTGAQANTFVFFLEYEPKDPSALAGIPRGDILNKRYQLATYNYNPVSNVGTALIRGASKGVVRSHVMREVSLIQGGAGSQGWTYQVSEQQYDSGIQFITNKSGAVMIKKFFGTGIDFVTEFSTNRGIYQFQIDGVNATAANFPSAILQGPQFNPATGRVDAYNAATLQGQRISFANISSVPQWHTLKITNTGTANGSSSDIYLTAHYFDIHGAVQVSDHVYGKYPMLSAVIGGVKDLRFNDPLGLSLAQSKCIQASGVFNTPSIGSGQFISIDGMVMDIVMDADGPVALHVDYDANPQSSLFVLLDGRYLDAGSLMQITTVPGSNHLSRVVFLKKGIHHLSGFIAAANNFAFSTINRGLSVIPLAPNKGA